MVRAAAKNHRFVNIVVNATDYTPILEEMRANDGATSLATRFDLAIKAYEHTAAYDGAIANHFGTLVPGGSPSSRAPSTPSSTRCRRCATARTRISRRRSMSRRSRRSRHRHRQAVTGQGAVLQQRGGHRRRPGVRQEFRGARLRNRQARQPLWCGRCGRNRQGL